MITFKEYLLEEDEEDSGEQAYSVQEAVQLYLKNCKQWQDVKVPLHRFSEKWSSKNKIRVGDVRERQSASRGGTRPIQDYLFSQPGWEDYPSRSKSIFCSTSKSSALGSTNMMIYPFDKLRIGVTPFYDLNLGDWFIGVPQSERDQFNGMSPRWFVELIGEIYEDIIDPQSSPRPKDFISNMNKIKEVFSKNGKFDELANGDDEIEERYDEANLQKRQFIKILVNHVPECFKPERMGFTLESPATIELETDGKGREVWFSGKYLSVPAQYWTQFVQEVKAAK